VCLRIPSVSVGFFWVASSELEDSIIFCTYWSSRSRIGICGSTVYPLSYPMALVADSLPETVSPPTNILSALWDDIAHPIIVSAIPGKLIAKQGGLWTI
jgi:hypothetical protein